MADAAIFAGEEALSFAAIEARAAEARAALVSAGARPGSRVAVLARNSVETLVSLHALIDLGATLVPVHPRLTPAEVEAQLADARPALTIRDGEIVPGSSEPPRAGAPLAIVYTSGTSGRAKGAVLSRRAFAAAAEASARNLGWTDDDRWLCCLPLCHIGGLAIVTRCRLARRPVILEPRFDPDAVLSAIVRHHATLISVVPTMLHALLERDRDNRLGRLRAMLVGGAAVPFAQLEECARRGVRALTTYGLTEACSQVTSQAPLDPYRARRGSGRPLSGVEVRVARADGAPTEIGEVGRLLVRSAALMDGYFRGPDAPIDRAVDADGFFDTGDLGERDAEGTLHVHTRRSDLVITGGENVYPVEVEQRLEAVAGVRRALVFGVPDARWGQLVAAVLELSPGAALPAVVAEAAGALAPHKRPRLACAVPALPLTASGKVERSRAAERFASLLAPCPPPPRARE